MVVVGAQAASNAWHHESGLLAVTLMGVILANQRVVPMDRITEFKESLTVLLISCLFILLSARVRLEDLTALGWRVSPSAGNFVLADTGGPALPCYERLLRAGVIVRPVANYGLPDHLRITVGLPEQNERLLSARRSLMAGSTATT